MNPTKSQTKKTWIQINGMVKKSSKNKTPFSFFVIPPRSLFFSKITTTYFSLKIPQTMNNKQQNLAKYPKTQNPNQGFEQKIHNMVKTKKHPKLKLKISTKC